MQEDTSTKGGGGDRFFGERIFPEKADPMPPSDGLSVNDCAQAHELFGRWADLSESDWLRLGPHLDHCDACRAFALEVAKKSWGSGTA